MDRRIVLPAMALALVAIGLGVVGSLGSAAPVFAANGAKPTFNVVLSSATVHQGDGNWVDTWLFVTNPSHDLTTVGSSGGRTIVHVVTVESLTCAQVYPNGTTETDTFTPNDVMFHYRWDPVVNPLERSLVFFVGWNAAETTGIWRFKYTLTVTYEGQTFNLVESFRVIVRP
jgi:hypothetical protein